MPGIGSAGRSMAGGRACGGCAARLSGGGGTWAAYGRHVERARARRSAARRRRPPAISSSSVVSPEVRRGLEVSRLDGEGAARPRGGCRTGWRPDASEAWPSAQEAAGRRARRRPSWRRRRSCSRAPCDGPCLGRAWAGRRSATPSARNAPPSPARCRSARTAPAPTRRGRRAGRCGGGSPGRG